MTFRHRLLLTAALAALAACGDDASNTDDKGPDQGEGASCAESVANWDASCEPGVQTLEECEDDRRHWLGMHCDPEWAAYATCTAAADPDCEEGGFPDCERFRTALFQCQSSFVQRTSCTRIYIADEECSDASAPYALLCLGDAPDAACKPRGEGAEGTNPVCCP
jgi:hypothetical protein